jgi:hypothetical protein
VVGSRQHRAGEIEPGCKTAGIGPCSRRGILEGPRPPELSTPPYSTGQGEAAIRWAPGHPLPPCPSGRRDLACIAPLAQRPAATRRIALRLRGGSEEEEESAGIGYENLALEVPQSKEALEAWAETRAYRKELEKEEAEMDPDLRDSSKNILDWVSCLAFAPLRLACLGARHGP